MEELYRKSAKTVYGFLYSLCGNKDLAEDLCQETFLKAIESIERYDGSCKFSVWLCQIGRHLWYQYLRKSKRELPMSDSLEVIIDSISKGKSPEEIVETKWEIKRVLEVISGFDDEKRAVLVLRLIYEMSFKEIGFALKKTENWARVTFFRAKEKMVLKLEESYGK